MAADAVLSNSDDKSSIALLRRLRAGAIVHFVHLADVCSAAPADLVANLEPAPGTEGRTWYFYCPKKFKNAQGKSCGHRQRAISGGDTCWHAEGRPKGVEGSEGHGTACNLSYGRKDGRSFSRLGWCMMEYDDEDQTDATGYVLCKIYRSPRAIVKVKPSSSSAKSSSSGSKRKAASGEQPEARPAKLSPDHVDTAFSYDYAMPPCYDGSRMIGDVGYGQQHIEVLGRGKEEEPSPSVEPAAQDREFVDTIYGPLLSELAQEISTQGNEFVEMVACSDDVVFAVEAEATVEELVG
ncbi:unnamed protein product [Urochloa humidicola]